MSVCAQSSAVGASPSFDEETDGEQRGQQRRRADEQRPRAAASLRLAAVQGDDADGEEERREGADEVQIADDLDGSVSLFRSGSLGLTLS